jgi:DNA sulfur modification protein DndC
MVKEDKSLKRFIDQGEKSLIPLRDYRNWLMKLRSMPSERDKKRRNGSVSINANGNYNLGPFTMAARQKILIKLLELENEMNLELITLDELKVIDRMWENDGDLSRRKLVETYYLVKNKRLPWDEFRTPIYNNDVVNEIGKLCDEMDFPVELISKLLVEVENNKNYTRSSKVNRAFDKVLNQGWLHFEEIRKGIEKIEN